MKTFQELLCGINHDALLQTLNQILNTKEGHMLHENRTSHRHIRTIALFLAKHSITKLSGRDIMRFVLYTKLLWKQVPYFLEITQPNSLLIIIVFAGHYVRYRFGLEQIRLNCWWADGEDFLETKIRLIY